MSTSVLDARSLGLCMDVGMFEVEGGWSSLGWWVMSAARFVAKSGPIHAVEGDIDNVHGVPLFEGLTQTLMSDIDDRSG